MPNKQVAVIITASFIAQLAPQANAADHLVVQKHKSFVVSSLIVKVGDTVTFMNLDPVHHNAFSLSPSNPFDTGMSIQGESRTVGFGSPGVVEVECAVHPGMRMIIEVRR